jgi:ribosomal protein S18 acetylase RimI-like enzyme
MSGPFSTTSIDLDATGQGSPRRLILAPLQPGDCAGVAAQIVAMEPWSVMDYPAERLSAFLAATEGGVSRYAIEIGGERAGVISIRYPWLKGPYLELLALLPPFQSQRIGSRLLAWLETEAVAIEARNLWVCASSFNERALRFYRRNGFRTAATLPGLVADGFEEMLLRKFPLRPPA